MEMKGEQTIPAPQQLVWEALNDPEILKACVPGCDAITLSGENTYDVLMVARVGPVSAKFKGKLTLSDIKPPESYAIAFEGQGGAAGFAKGSAQVRLEPAGAGTKLSYETKANVGGKLAQIGSRLVDAAARKVADDFFKNFNAKVAAMASDEDTTLKPVAGLPADADEDTTLKPVKKAMPADADEDETIKPVKLAPAREPQAPAHKDPHASPGGAHSTALHAAHDDHDDHHPQPVPRDPDLPTAGDSTVAFFAAGSLVVFVVSLVVLL